MENIVSYKYALREQVHYSKSENNKSGFIIKIDIKIEDEFVSIYYDINDNGEVIRRVREKDIWI